MPLQQVLWLLLRMHMLLLAVLVHMLRRWPQERLVALRFRHLRCCTLVRCRCGRCSRWGLPRPAHP